jgi:hypothetical protein
MELREEVNGLVLHLIAIDAHLHSILTELQHDLARALEERAREVMQRRLVLDTGWLGRRLEGGIRSVPVDGEWQLMWSRDVEGQYYDTVKRKTMSGMH